MTPVNELLAMVRTSPIDTDALARGLDAANHDTRLAFVRSLTPLLQRRLFDACSRPVTTRDIVPEGVAPLAEVICEGRNTLPVFRNFQKRFCLPSAEHTPDNRRVLWGYNHQTFSGITGPGYFVAYDDDRHGELVIDYRELPPERPGSWPAILDNRARLGRFVYAGMVDRLRGVSTHVTIGRAFKANPMNAWFALVRVDP
ncbi:hypothetical protein DL240_08360 [Lujinxingia litoralis]|uniref:Uncharacterized protein n=1 Tax=Lujinxingia litoralis TaxID=2211119 RepID=A0A328C6L7_9DELT|nr:hypothetical protein [Lujinxingia litoralis]RAL22896.1 hypothetical protein DL240_08360 [Lujinxingia litoralis]